MRGKQSRQKLKINKLLVHITAKTDLYELSYAGVKVVCAEISVP